MITMVTSALLLPLRLIFITSVIGTESCPQYCSLCSVEMVRIVTDHPNPFPLNLDPKTQRLAITYIGDKGFRLTASMVNRYQLLKELSVTGNVSSIEERAFTKQDRLTSLTIQNSLLQNLHYNIFGNRSKPSNLR